MAVTGTVTSHSPLSSIFLEGDTMNVRRTHPAKLTCGLCGKVVDTILMENSQGVIRINEFLCADDLSIMLMEIVNDKTAGVDKKGNGNVSEAGSYEGGNI